jgi:biotin carboxylase
MKRRLVMIEVQPTASGARLLEAVIERGFELLLLTSDEPWFRANLPPEVQAGTTVVPVRWDEDKRAQIRSILSSYERASLAGIMTVRDSFIEAVSQAAAELGLAFTDRRAIAICRNKERTRAVTSAIGVRNPLSQVAGSLEEARAFCGKAGFPVVLKPSKGSGSAGVILCSDDEELTRAVPGMLKDCADKRELLQIEEYVPGPVVSVEAVTFDGRTKILGVTDRGIGPQPRFMGVSWTFPAQTAPETDARLREITTGILDRIGYGLGYSHTEFVLGADGPVLVEINARIAGVNIAELMAQTMGIDVFGIMVDMFTGRNLEWLFQREFAPRHGMTELVIKPETNGKVKKLGGVDLARRFPGVVTILRGLKPGDEVLDRHHLLTFGARIFSRGGSAFESLVRAKAAANAIQLEMER